MQIIVEHLSITPFGAAAPVLNDVSFEVAKGETVLLLGASGAGKSTLLLALSGVLQSLESAEITGSIHIGSSGLLLQNAIDAAVGETILRDVAFGAESAGIGASSIANLVAKSLSQVGIDLPKERAIGTLSGGELQRVCLAGLLTLAPKVLLLDEPTSMLDSKSAAEVRAAVAEYLRVSGATAIIAEHIFEPWLPLVTQVLVLGQGGRLIQQGPTKSALMAHRQSLLDQGLWMPNIKLNTPEAKPAKGKLVVLVGPSGSGKSTWLRSKLDQLLLSKQPRQIGWQPQNPSLALVGSSSLANAPTEWLQEFALAHHSDQNPMQLSGGEQRRLALAAAFTNRPDYLLLDEPTVGQDTANWSVVMNAVLEARARGAQIWVATHDQQLISLADEVLEISPSVQTQTPETKSGSRSATSPLAIIGTSLLLLVGSLFFVRLEQLEWALIVEAAAYIFAAVAFKSFGSLRLAIPVLIGLASIFVSNWWLSDAHNVQSALFNALRIGFFVLPAVFMLGSMRPARLGDQFGQTLGLPARPVVATVVALGRIGRFQETWQQLVLLRTLRGLRHIDGPLSWVRELIAMTFGVLIEAIRGATTTAIAMEARGFGNRNTDGKLVKRTWAVSAEWGRLDGLLILGATVAIWFGLAHNTLP